MSEIIIDIQDQPIEIDVINTPGVGVPTGGTTGQILKKSSSTDYDTYWATDIAGVPYLGATGDVDLGEHELKAGQLELDQTPTGVAGVAVTRWNDSVGTTETTLKGGNVVLKHGRDMFERVVNKTGIQLTKAAYQAVRISSAQGQRLGIELAQANNDANSADTIGLVVETIDNNQEGIIYTVGEITGINTTGSLQGETWVDGDVLYLSPTTAGRITNVKPVAPQHLVLIGYVVYAHANNGKIYVKTTNGFELGELHDVNTNGATNGQVLKYDGTIWTPSTDVGITGTGANGQVSYWTGTGTQSGSNNLFWDNTNGRLGIGTATPSEILHLSGNNNGSTNDSPIATIRLEDIDSSVANNQPIGKIQFWANDATVPMVGEAAYILAKSAGSSGGGYMAFGTSDSATLATERMRITANGNVGIGTNAPTESLQVVGGNILIDNNRAFRTKNTAGSTLDTIKADTSNNLLLGSLFFGGGFYSYTNTSFRWFQYPSSVATERMQLSTLGNLLIGSATDAGQRLQVTGDTLMRGSGNTSATTALTVQNSDATNLFRILNDNTINIGLRPAVSIYPTAFGSVQNITGRGIAMSFIASDTAYEPLTLTHGNLTSTANGYLVFNTIGTFNPTSGTATYTANRIGSTINQTGGANGITRGLYVNPTLTAAADWRSIEWSNNTGWGLYGAGTSPNYLAGRLQIGNTSSTGEALQVTGTMKVTGASTFGGNVTIPIGSYNAPSLSFASDSNTGMFSPLADNLEIKTGTHNAVILENQGYNFMQYSEELGSFPTNFQQISVSIPGSVVAPDGKTNASIAIPDTSLNQHRFFRSYTIGGPNTSSVYAKSAGYNFISLAATGGTAGETIIFDIVNGTISGTSGSHTASIEDVGNGWFRCSLTSTNVTAPTTFSRWIIVRNANSTASYSGDGTSGVYLWGWQIEEGSASTSYIRTGATGITRPQAVSILGQNLYGNLITRKIGAPSLTDFALTTDYTDRLIVKATTGNVILNSSSDSGERLQVTGTMKVTGSTSIDGNTFNVDATNDRVGIGTATPSVLLHTSGVDGSNTNVLRLTNTANLGGTLWANTVSHDIQFHYTDPSFGPTVYGSIRAVGSPNSGTDPSGGTIDTDLVFLNAATIGGGGLTEKMRIKATGQIRFTPRSSAPSGAQAGDVYYNSTDNKHYGYNGTTWNAFY